MKSITQWLIFYDKNIADDNKMSSVFYFYIKITSSKIINKYIIIEIF